VKLKELGSVRTRTIFSNVGVIAFQDKRKRYHNTSGPAIFGSDGSVAWLVHGKYVKENL